MRKHLKKSCIPLFLGMLSLFNCFSLSARIIETSQMEEILSYIEPEESTLVLFDIDGTLIDSEVSLNSGKWISFYWKLAPKVERDLSLLECLMWYVNRHIPVKPVDPKTPQLIQNLQSKENVLALALTARNYSSEFNDNITAQQIGSIGIDFSTHVSGTFDKHPSFHDGIIFSSGKAKGGHLQEVLDQVGYRPNKMIFIDDKLEQVLSVDKAMQMNGIDCDCFFYRPEEGNQSAFNPSVTLIQLEYLLLYNKILSDPEAEILEGEYSDIKHEDFIRYLLETYKSLFCKN